MRFLSKKTIVLASIVGLIVAIVGIAHTVEIEADRPLEIRSELWFDTMEFYKQTSEFVDKTLDGEPVSLTSDPGDLPDWIDKYLDIAIDSSLVEHTRSEYELAKAMKDMYDAGINTSIAYWENKMKKSDASEEKLEMAIKRYEDAKEKVEDILYVWKW